MLSIGLVINLLSIVAAAYIFKRSLQLLYELIDPDEAYNGLVGLARVVASMSGLLIWFSVGTMMMVVGLTGLFNKMIIALQ